MTNDERGKILESFRGDYELSEARKEVEHWKNAAGGYRARWKKATKTILRHREEIKLLKAIRESVRNLDSWSAKEAVRGMCARKQTAVMAYEAWELATKYTKNPDTE